MTKEELDYVVELVNRYEREIISISEADKKDNAEVVALKAEVRDVRGWCAELEDDGAKLRDKVVRLNEALAEKERAIIARDAAVAAMSGEIARLNDELAETGDGGAA